MPKRVCVPCLSSELREAIIRSVPRDAEAALVEILAGVPDCAQVKPAKDGGKEKRAPSAYNTFIGTCMKAGNITKFKDAPERMKHCAAAWRAQKGK